MNKVKDQGSVKKGYLSSYHLDLTRKQNKIK